jgi:uncharacterized protein YggE
MDIIRELKGLKIKNNCLIKTLSVIIILFFLSLTILVSVKAINETKEGKYIGQEIESRNTISVSGTGEIYTKPDLAITTFSVKTEAKTVAEAMVENTEKMNDIIASMKEQGIEEKDLKTTSFNIYPRYEYERDESSLIYPPPSKRVLVGYEIYQSLQVKIRDMAKIGDIIQAATDAGANETGGLQFTIDKEDEFEKQAREEAIKEAQDKARALASQLGVRLVRITNFQEGGVLPRYYELDKATGMGGGESVEVPAPQIETGENLIQITVTITYEIN